MTVAWLCFSANKIACLATTGDVSTAAKITALFAGYAGAAKDLFTGAFDAVVDAATATKTTEHTIESAEKARLGTAFATNYHSIVCVQQKANGDWAATNLNAIVARAGESDLHNNIFM